MGADIHVYVERWTNSNDYEGPKDISEDRDNKLEQLFNEESTHYRWVSADKWIEEDGYLNVGYYDRYYNDRNYELFSILADVRGSYSAINPPRGIPKDASFGYKYICNLWLGDGHSHSYYTLTELLSVDWSLYNECYLDNFLKSIERMKSIDADTDNVRMCFFFDN